MSYTSSSQSSLSSNSSSSESSRSSFSSKSTSSNSSVSKSSVSSLPSLSTSSSSGSSQTMSPSSWSSKSSISSSRSSKSSSNSSVSLSSLSSSKSSKSSSSSVSSASSRSSKTSKSSSSTLGRSSSTSSSTIRFSSSSSSSNSSYSSSSSSGDEGTVTIPIRVEGLPDNSVWGFTSRTDDNNLRTVYAGTGPSGVVLKSTNLTDWEPFMTVSDSHALSIVVWANALFIGTRPHGKIFVHNFTSGQEYLFVETEDEAVTAFAEHNGVLYAGTSPTGIVYSFDGILWSEEHRPYGRGVSSMVSTGEGLMVFSRNAEGPVVYSDGVWKPYATSTNGDAHPTVASSRVANRGIYGNTGQTILIPSNMISANAGSKPEEMSAVKPTSPQFDILAAASLAGGAIFGGRSNGVIWKASGNTISKLTDIGVPVNTLLTVNDATVMVASGKTLFLAKESS